MKRRSFLAMLGFAPAAAAVPVVAAEMVVRPPVVLTDGRLYMSDANLGAMSSGIIRAGVRDKMTGGWKYGGMTIDLGAGTIQWDAR